MAKLFGKYHFNRRHFVSFALICIAAQIPLVAGPIAEGCDKFLGNVSTDEPPANFLDYWNQVTLENNGKWANVEPNRDQFNWTPIQKAYDFCKKNNIPYKHHTFLWNEQYPSWVDALSAADKKAAVEKLISEFGKKFPETAYIDVVNEARRKAPKWKDALGGDGVTGYDWIVWGFETTKKYCPNAKLLINEYYCEFSLDTVAEYLKIINVLKQKNLIDGIGLQTHDAETKKGYDMGIFKKCLDSLATSGVPLYSTEFDMSGNDSVQLAYYKNIFPIIWEHPAMRGVTLWGWTDSWLLHISNPKDARLIINNQERPALKWLRTYVAEHKKTIPGTPTYRIAAPPSREPSLSFDYSKGFFWMHTSDARTLTLRLIDPTGRIVFSIPQKSYPSGNHAIPFSSERMGAGCYLFSAQGADGEMTGNKLIGW